ncbi:hypothetical protein MNBD_GAMMA10-2492 [hydrothermal vent metagenome]|uniref:YkgJ family cysteine cluster protein n=1 Tax=hydrothermal vent metagenome TaxID=652676 RepID=A0A3B0YYH2_9ZZZZ
MIIITVKKHGLKPKKNKFFINLRNLKYSFLNTLFKKSISKYNASFFIRYFYDVIDDVLMDFRKKNNINIDCKINCDWCCYLRTTATSAEIFHLVRHIKSSFSTLDVLELIERAKLSSNLAENKNATNHHEKNIPCSLLKNGRCEAYEARPLACRMHHSTDENICQRDFELPHTYYDTPTEYSSLVLANSYIISLFNKVLRSRKPSINKYEINQALLKAIENPALEKLWLEGQDVFKDNET